MCEQRSSSSDTARDLDFGGTVVAMDRYVQQSVSSAAVLASNVEDCGDALVELPMDVSAPDEVSDARG